MPDNTTTIAELKEIVRRFAAEREWQPFHSPKNLAMGLAVEAGELMEHFLWVDTEASRTLAQDPARKQAIGEEMADVLAYLLNLANVLDLDLSAALEAK